MLKILRNDITLTKSNIDGIRLKLLKLMLIKSKENKKILQDVCHVNDFTLYDSIIYLNIQYIGMALVGTN